jgi:hypothetical protein
LKHCTKSNTKTLTYAFWEDTLTHSPKQIQTGAEYLQMDKNRTDCWMQIDSMCTLRRNLTISIAGILVLLFGSQYVHKQHKLHWFIKGTESRSYRTRWLIKTKQLLFRFLFFITGSVDRNVLYRTLRRFPVIKFELGAINWLPETRSPTVSNKTQFWEWTLCIIKNNGTLVIEYFSRTCFTTGATLTLKSPKQEL